MVLLLIMFLSIVIQFLTAGIALFLIRKSHRSWAWIHLAAAFFLMGLRRTISFADVLSQPASTLDLIAEGMALLSSVLMLAGVWLIRGLFDRLNALRIEAEEQVDKRKKAEDALTDTLREAEDATARLQQSEERLRFLGDNLPGVLLYQLDTGVDGRDRHFTHVSRGVEEIHEMSVAEVMEAPFAIYTQMYEEDTQPFAELEKAALETMSVFRAETRIRLPSGKTKWILIASAPRRSTDNHLLWNGFEIDITDRKRLEEALLRHSETLEKAVAERTARLRHLTAELVQAEQRERRRLSDFLHDDLQQVLFGANLIAARLVSAHPAGAFAYETEKLRELMTEALKKTRALSKELVTPLLYVIGLVPALRQVAGQMHERYGIDVALDLQDVQEVREEALRVQLFHSVRELLFNAAKHSGTKAARLRGRMSGDRIELSVEDDGKGFDPRGILQGPATEQGCGLFSVHERIGALGGTMTVDSAPGCGTRVTISVPLQPDQDAPPQNAGQPPAVVRSANGAEGRTRVLVADDHALMRRGVVTLLSKDPELDVVGEAANGLEAVTLARQLHPDVIIMDVRMPEMGGIEATRIITSELPDAIVIGLSAFVDEGFRTEMLNAGAKDLLNKGSAGERLLERVAECLEQRGKGPAPRC